MDGQFIEVMVIQTAADEAAFKKLYNLESVRKEY